MMKNGSTPIFVKIGNTLLEKIHLKICYKKFAFLPLIYAKFRPLFAIFELNFLAKDIFDFHKKLEYYHFSMR